MKFLQITLKVFGKFDNHLMDFSARNQHAHSFYMIVGQNEAGKSTAQAAMLKLFYGMKKQDSYNFMGRQTLWVGARMLFSDGQELSLWRKSGMKGTLFGPDQKSPLPDSVLECHLENITEKNYLELFGLDQNRLREGGERLASGEGEFADILLGESLGNLYLFDRYRKELIDKAGELFKSGARGRANSPLNNIKLNLEEIDNRFKENSTSTSTWTELQHERDELNEERSEKERQIKELLDRKNHVQKRLNSYEDIRLYKECLEEIDLLQEIPTLKRRLKEDFTKAETNRKKTLSQIENELKDLDEKKTQLRPITWNQSFIDHSAEIKRLFQNASLFKEQIQKRDTLLSDLRTDELTIQNLLHEIGFSQADFERITPIDTQLKNRLIDHAMTITNKNREIGELKRTINEIQNHLAVPEQTEEIDILHARLKMIKSLETETGLIQSDWNSLKILEQNHRKSRTLIDKLLNEIPLWSGSVEEFLSLKLPSFDQVRLDLNHLSLKEDELKSSQKKLKELQSEASGLEEKIRKNKEEFHIPTAEELNVAREQRNQYWKDLKADWLSNVEIAFEEKSRRAEELDKSLVQADGFADRLRQSVEIVSDTLRLHELQGRITSEETRISHLQQEFDTLFEIWQNHYIGLGIRPANSSEVDRWEPISKQIREEHASLQTFHDEIFQIKERWRIFLVEKLCNAFPDSFSPLDSIEHAGKTILQFKEDLTGQISQFRLKQDERQTLKQKLHDADQSLAEHQQSLSSLAVDWKALLTQAGLEPTRPHDHMERYLDRYDQCVKNISQYQKDQREYYQLNDRIMKFQQDLHRLSELIEFRDFSGTELQDIFLIHDRYQSEKDKFDQHESISKEIEGLEKKIENLRSELNGYQEEISGILSEIKVLEISDAEEQFDKIEKKSKLLSESEQMRKNIKKEADITSLEEWNEETLSKTVDEWKTLKGEVEKNIISISHERDKINGELGVNDEKINKIKKRAGEGTASAIKSDELMYIDETDENIRKYLRLTLTHCLLIDAAEEYRQQSGEQVLNMASRFFRELSLGSFQGLHTQPTSTGGYQIIAVRDMEEPEDTGLHLQQLSEGTRDQLFLALKLAMIHHRLQERKLAGLCPLPVIFDDILVQFDDLRAMAAFQLFKELAQQTQVIFLTHHQHLEHLANKALGQGQFGVVHLDQPTNPEEQPQKSGTLF